MESVGLLRETNLHEQLRATYITALKSYEAGDVDSATQAQHEMRSIVNRFITEHDVLLDMLKKRIDQPRRESARTVLEHREDDGNVIFVTDEEPVTLREGGAMKAKQVEHL